MGLNDRQLGSHGTQQLLQGSPPACVLHRTLLPPGVVGVPREKASENSGNADLNRFLARGSPHPSGAQWRCHSNMGASSNRVNHFPNVFPHGIRTRLHPSTVLPDERFVGGTLPNAALWFESRNAVRRGYR